MASPDLPLSFSLATDDDVDAWLSDPLDMRRSSSSTFPWLPLSSTRESSALFADEEAALPAESTFAAVQNLHPLALPSTADDYEHGRRTANHVGHVLGGSPLRVHNTTDFVNRDLACAKALQQPSLTAVFARIDPDPTTHYLTKVYTSRKDEVAPIAGARRTPLDEPVSLFQSTRNCKRHVHAYLYLRLHYGSDYTITD